MRDVFCLELYPTGQAGLFLRKPTDSINGIEGHALTPTDAECFKTRAAVTPALLRMLTSAYRAGYTKAAMNLGAGPSQTAADECPEPTISEAWDWNRE